MRGSVSDWRLSQRGFDPIYGKLVCLPTLMSTDGTKQIYLRMTIYINIYIMIMIMLINIYIYYCFDYVSLFSDSLMFNDISTFVGYIYIYNNDNNNNND